jgi:superfamily II DNA helicase RecQ
VRKSQNFHTAQCLPVIAPYELIEILNQKPQDLNAMGQISGVGQAKLDRYGAAFLAVIAEVD